MNSVYRLLVMSVAVGLIGCGQGLKTLNEPASNEGLGVDITQPEGQKEVDAIGEEAMDSANKVVEEVNDEITRGKIDFDDLLDTSKLDDLKDEFEDNLDPIFGVLDKVKAKILTLKAKVQVELDLLDPNVPEHAEAIAKLEEVMAKLDKAIAKIDGVAEKILDKLNKLYEKLDKLIAKIDEASLIWIILKSEFRQFKDDKVGGMRILMLALLAKG